MSAKRFRIAFSFAGEKREFVASVARILAQRFGEAAILYDRYHKPEFSRSDLAFYLPDLYEKEADLVVAVFCPEYEAKPWCGLEWNAIFGLLKLRRDDEVMLMRFGNVEGKGLRGLAGYTDLDDLTPEQAAGAVLERLAFNEGKPRDYFKQSAVVDSKPLSSVTPNNLPRLQSFFGREEELKTIRDALDPESRTWGALIDGPGGMGKTSLAVRAAYDCPPGQFQRIIFVSVKDRELDDDGVRKLGGFTLPGFIEMLNELARELGQADIAKAPEDQRIRLVLDALRPAQALLILDNLESLAKDDRDQLFTFVKRLPQGCKAILTSRRRMGSGSELLILEELDQAAALATLAELARRNPLLAKTSETERIALHAQTGGKPLLLRWVAGQLGRGRCRTVADALHFLRSCPSDNDPLEYIFGDLAREFTAQETRVLVALTYFTLPAKLEHLVDSTGLDEATIDSALRSLANRSLAVPNQEETAFVLVAMVADFLRHKHADVVTETGSRLLECAYALIVKYGYKDNAPFTVLDAAWPIVAASLPLFVSEPNTRLATVCKALTDFFNFTGRWDESLSLHRHAERTGVAAGDHSNAGMGAFEAAWIHVLRRQADDVLDCAERAAEHWRAAQSGARAGKRRRAMAIQLRGIGQDLKADHVAAIASFREALQLFSSLSPTSQEVCSVLNSLACTEHMSGDLAAAERDYREALRLANALGSGEERASCTCNLALLALDREDWPQAEALARDAVPLSEKVGRYELIADSCRHLAWALLRQGKPAEALPYAQRAVEIYSRLGSTNLDSARAALKECRP